MNINTNSLISMTKANQNFSQVAKLVDENGSAIILKNNKPKYVLIEFEEFKKYEKQINDEIDIIAERLLMDNLEAFKELAK